MKRLQQRATEIGRAAQRRKVAEIKHATGDIGIRAEALDDAVVLRGSGLVMRWLSETSLRFVTGLLR